MPLQLQDVPVSLGKDLRGSYLYACASVVGCRHSPTECTNPQFFQWPAELGNAVQTDDLLFFVLGDAYQVRPAAGQRVLEFGIW